MSVKNYMNEENSNIQNVCTKTLGRRSNIQYRHILVLLFALKVTAMKLTDTKNQGIPLMCEGQINFSDDRKSCLHHKSEFLMVLI